MQKVFVRRWVQAVLGILLAAAGSATAADGAALYQARCAACHGNTGVGNAALQAPPLAGQDAAYLARQLRQFQSKQRGGEQPSGAVAGMQAVAQALPDDAAVAALAQHIARLKPPSIKAASPPPGSLSNAGKAAFATCIACHGSGGEGKAALAAPRLNILPAWYTESQLKAYRDGTRGSHADDKPGQQMQQIARDTVADEQTLKGVSEYIATLGTGRR